MNAIVNMFQSSSTSAMVPPSLVQMAIDGVDDIAAKAKNDMAIAFKAICYLLMAIVILLTLLPLAMISPLLAFGIPAFVVYMILYVTILGRTMRSKQSVVIQEIPTDTIQAIK